MAKFRVIDEPSNPNHCHQFTEKARVGKGMWPGYKGRLVKMCWRCSAYLVNEDITWPPMPPAYPKIRQT